MPGIQKRTLHPLLLERSYWRNRLQELRLAPLSVLMIPRPDLSSPLVEVTEFRIRTHDGIRLFGLRAQGRFGTGSRCARLRIVGPSDLPHIDPSVIENGESEFVLQEPAGRKLEDRVLDVLRMCQLASAAESAHPRRIVFGGECGQEHDEFLIASQLLADEVDPPLPAPFDDGAGFGAAP